MVNELLLSGAAGILIMTLYISIFTIASRWQTVLSTSGSVVLALSGFILRLFFLVIIIRSAIIFFKLNLTYLIVSLLLTHTAWLFFLILSNFVGEAKRTRGVGTFGGID